MTLSFELRPAHRVTRSTPETHQLPVGLSRTFSSGSTVSDLMKLNTLVLQLALAKVLQTPSQAIGGSGKAIVDYLRGVADSVGLAAGWLTFGASTSAGVNEIMAGGQTGSSWTNEPATSVAGDEKQCRYPAAVRRFGNRSRCTLGPAGLGAVRGKRAGSASTYTCAPPRAIRLPLPASQAHRRSCPPNGRVAAIRGCLLRRSLLTRRLCRPAGGPR
jgi:hypothetical protein